jgi:N-acetyltransferase
MINFALSSPPLTGEALAASKVYLFLLTPSKATTKERIAGCVVAQRISTALEVVNEKPASSSRLVCVDQGVYCK